MGLKVTVAKNDWPRIARQLHERAPAIIEDIAQDALTAMKSDAPFAHIKAGLTIRRRGILGRDIWGPWDWLFPNYGTVRQAARPYVEPNLNRARAALDHRLPEILR